MDTISTGIGGALLARALPERWRGPSGVAVMVFASVLPDADVVADFFASGELERIAWHRSFTHSLVGVAVMAPLGALVARRLGKDKNYGRVVGLMTYGLLWHLFTDLATSWGTQVFYPLSRERVVWDWMFIIDFIFTAILLLPLVLAWIYPFGGAQGRDRERRLALKRGTASWAALAALMALMIAWAAPFFGLGFQWKLFALLSGALAALFLLPALGGWGFRTSAATFARVGVAALVALRSSPAKTTTGCCERRSCRRCRPICGSRASRWRATARSPSSTSWSGATGGSTRCGRAGQRLCFARSSTPAAKSSKSASRKTEEIWNHG